MELTPRQKAFTDFYIELGNAESAALKAGYSKTYARARSHELLAKVGIKERIEELNKVIESDRIATMEEVKQFWTNTMRDELNDKKDRLKASEYIAKTNAAFIEKTEVSGEMKTTTEVKHDLSKLTVEELKQFETLLSKSNGD